MPLILPHGFMGTRSKTAIIEDEPEPPGPITPVFIGADFDPDDATNMFFFLNGVNQTGLRAYVLGAMWQGNVNADSVFLIWPDNEEGELFTPITSKVADSGNNRAVQFFKIDINLPSSALSEVVILAQFSGTTGMFAGALWDLGPEGVGRDPVDDDSSSASSSAGARSATVNVDIGGCVLAMYGARDSGGTTGALTWTNATERADASIESGARYSAADASGLSTGNRTVTATPANTESQNVLQAVAW